MPACDAFEIAIEMWAHGALGGSERAALEAHLLSCDRCRAFEATARGTERLMQGMACEGLQHVDWGWVRRYVRRSRIRMAASAIAFTLVAVTTIWSLLHPPADPSAARQTVLLAAVTAFVFGRFSIYFGNAWRVARLQQGEELIASIRVEQRESARAIRIGIAFLAATMAGFAWQATLGAEPLRSRNLVCVAIAAAGLAYLWFVNRRRVARERAELDGATRPRDP